MPGNEHAVEERLAAALRETWGYREFRPHQLEAMHCAMGRRDSLVVLPTGGGKSLCFQVPALLARGTTVVVSPLISLMKDQVDQLRQAGVPSACVNSALSASERRETDAAIRAGQLKLLYVAPERLMKAEFAEYLQRVEVSGLVIDEAHCISQWGHDFRPEYRELGRLRELFPGLAVHAFTATATPQVRADIIAQLHLKDPAVIVGSFDRPNLVYHVEEQRAKDDAVLEIVARQAGHSGIIYCITRRHVEALCERLQADRVPARPYHAGLSDDERRANQEAFVRDEAPVIVATVAFGMGINKPDVRFVIHAGMPKSLEHYQQEAGRAGRDGLEAECHLLYSGGDYGLWRGIIEKNEQEGAATQLAKLTAMYQFCKDLRCRHSALCEYFGEPPMRGPCGACDVCLGTTARAEDAGALARTILTAVREVDERFGIAHVARVLAGTRDEKTDRHRHHKLGSFAAMRGESERDIRDWISALVSQDYLQRTGEYNTLSLTRDGADFLRDEAASPPLLQRRGTQPAKRRTAAAIPPSLAAMSAADQGLFEALRGARRALAVELGMPPFMILPDTALRDLAARKPCDAQGFGEAHGIGHRKVAQYASHFLPVIKSYCDEHGLAPGSASPAPRTTRAKREKSANSAKEQAFGHFERGASLEETAEATGRALSTICGYLTEYLRGQAAPDTAPWLSEAEFERIRAAIERVGPERLRPIFEALDGEVPYFKIHLALIRLRGTPSAG